jgi:TorA maturation chaperone TorD
MLPVDPAITVLLQAAAEWRLIGLLLACPQGDWAALVAALAAEVTDPGLRSAAEAAAAEAGEGLYHTTFGPGGPAAPREVSYRDAIVPGNALSDLGAFYEVFAYRPATDEPLDHVAVEADFVAFLRLKEAYAFARGDAEQAAVTADAARQFVDEHLSAIAKPLAESLASSGIPYLALTSEALLRRVGPPKPVVPAPPPLVALTDDPCGSGCTLEDEPG